MPDPLDQFRDRLRHLTTLARRLDASITAYRATKFFVPMRHDKAYDDALRTRDRAWDRIEEMEGVIAHAETIRQTLINAEERTPDV
jgi:hypothetical protein